MTITAIKGQAGDERAFCVCDACGAETSIPAMHGGNGKWMPGGKPRLHLQSPAAVMDALRKLGWSHIKNRLRGPTCEAARIAKKDVAVDMKQAAAPEPAGNRQPNRYQKRLIILALEDAYDAAAKRYRGDMTDRNLADQLGDGIMPGWVSELREDFFGPVGNEEVEALRAELAALAAAQVDLQKVLTDLGSRVAALTVRLNTCVGAHDKRVGGKVGA